MAEIARNNNVNLRPHVKTHKCVQIGKMQIHKGAKGITVSTLSEAEVFAASGFNDITYAVPISRNKIAMALELAQRVSLKIIVDNPHTVDILDAASKEARTHLDVLVKVDCGLHRCGVDPTSNTAVNLVRKIDEASNLNFVGILTHAGHSYSAKSIDEIKRIAQQEQDVMARFSKMLKREGLAPQTVSVGSTPTIVLADSFNEEITEVRPGNYVFYDYTQVALGTCKVSDCALTVLASIVGMYPDRIVIDAGATALSKDQGPRHISPNCGYGQVMADYEEGLLARSATIDSITQEHARISVPEDSRIHYKINDVIRILPNHSCLAANLFDEYVVLEGERIKARWRTRCIQRLAT
jgi:D-serine deaminase-like pyridoxal phosphate-dependent protein